MPINKNALIRYKTIDQCLQNRYRKWTLDNLIEACSNALYEYEGKMTNISKRTVQLDIQTMRSDKLGYNAPIIVVDRKYYTYEDPNYSITNLPVSKTDLEQLNNSVAILKQFKGFKHFHHLNEVVKKLEDYVYTQQNNALPVIDFEKNDLLKGIDLLDDLHKHIISRQTLIVEYQSFKKRFSNSFVFYPYLLKEYRNRWFLIGKRHKNDRIINLALDRIISIKKSDEKFQKNDVNLDDYYKDVLGVSVDLSAPVQNIKLFISREQAPYVETKPIHHSQQTIKRTKFGIIIQLRLRFNPELEKTLLSFGDDLLVIEPEKLKTRHKNRLNNALEMYKTDVQFVKINNFIKKFEHKSYAIINHTYNSREIKKINKLLYKELKNRQEITTFSLLKNKLLKELLLNSVIEKIIDKIEKKHILKDIIFYPETPNENIKWHQSEPNMLKIRLYLSKKSGKNTGFYIFEGSHKKILSVSEIATVTTNSTPRECQVDFLGIIVYQSVSLHKEEYRNKGYVELEFVRE